ncbi:MAG: glutathione S-transferase family protein [Pelagimonas sp.]
MLQLITFGGNDQEPSMSPFCTKAMICLNLAGQEWTPDYNADLPNLPRGKLPILRVGDGLIPDSNNIVRWLEEQGADLYPGLDRKQRALAYSVMRMLEENLRLGLVHDRWMDEGNWAVIKGVFFGGSDEAAEPVRAAQKAWLWGHGVARCDEAGRMEFMQPDLDVLTELLEGTDWLFGDKPSAVDAFAVPLLSSLVNLWSETALSRAITGNPVLMDYVARGRATFYPSLLGLQKAA